MLCTVYAKKFTTHVRIRKYMKINYSTQKITWLYKRAILHTVFETRKKLEK